MAKLTERQKKNIIARFKTGEYSKRELAKQYKVNEKTIRVITEGETHTNAHIVEVGAIYEAAKKSAKSPQEIKAIENAVKERTIADDIQDSVFSGTLLNVRSVSKKIEGEEVETIQEHKYAQETFDKALITAGKAPRHANSTITNTNTNKNNFTHIEISKAIADGLPD